MKLLLYLFLLFVSCTNDPKLVQEFISDEYEAIEKISEAELFHTENGKVKVKIIVGKIERFNKNQPELIFSDSLEVYFYNDSSKLQSTLKSNMASMDDVNKIMIAKNSVKLISNTGKKLETEELIWDERNNRVYTDKEVKITTGKEVVYGEGFTSNPDFTEYSIIKIHGTFDFDTETR